MNAGKLRHRIVFRRQAQVPDGYGNTVGEWQDLITVWSNVRETTGREAVKAGAIENNRTATIRIRSSTQSRGVTEADQVIARGETWNILGIANADDQGVMLDMLCQSGGLE